MTATSTDYDPATLPAPVLTYLDARDADRHADAAAVFAPDATVVDDGHTYGGVDAIGEWIGRSSTEFRYTSTRLGQRVEPHGADLRVRVDGDFPGGTVTLGYRFELAEGRIRHLTIAPVTA
ncbi:nuclear transport factor 2 family protein [Nocardia sp. NPDC057227]|uniref:nuclear transport factor 2 family protein n=1 Tax=Nocardia sp. NPDC057227 TaxID=3346056 RepID=UPI00363DC1A9